MVENLEIRKIGRPKESFTKKLSKLKITKKVLEALYRLGSTDEQVSQAIGVSEVTLHDWKKDNEFALPLNEWKSEADLKVEKALLKRALGYEYDEITYEQTKTGGLSILKASSDEIEGIKHVPTAKTKITTKQVAPDVTAQIFWLKNRKPNEWRDLQKHEHSGKVDLSLPDIWDETQKIRESLAKASTN